MFRLLAYIALLCLTTAPAYAEVAGEAVAQAAPVETFKPPHRIKTVSPHFPISMRRRGREGWVVLSLMVDAQGVPYDVTVADSSGDAAFEKAAIGAMSKARYDPAVYQGQNIDAGSAARITFQLSGATGATRAFVRRQKNLHKAIDADNREEADRLLAKINETPRNIYEESFRHLSLYRYYTKWGTVDQQLDALKRATYMDGNNGFLKEATMASVLLRQLGLQAQLSHFADAKQTVRKLEKFSLEEGERLNVAKIADAVDGAIASDGVIERRGVIQNHYRFVHRLARRSFEFDDIEGRIAELRLHCDKAYIGMIHTDELIYTVPDHLESCSLTVIGDPETSFVLREHHPINET